MLDFPILLPGDAPREDLALALDLTATTDLNAGGEAKAGPDLDAATADQGPDAAQDQGGGTADVMVTDGVTDGTTASGYKLFGEITSGAVVRTGGTYRLVSQVGHPMATQLLTGGQYTLRLRAKEGGDR